MDCDLLSSAYGRMKRLCCCFCLNPLASLIDRCVSALVTVGESGVKKMAECTVLLLCWYVPVPLSVWFSGCECMWLHAYLGPWGSLSKDMIDYLCTVVKVF